MLFVAVVRFACYFPWLLLIVLLCLYVGSGFVVHYVTVLALRCLPRPVREGITLLFLFLFLLFPLFHRMCEVPVESIGHCIVSSDYGITMYGTTAVLLFVVSVS